MASENTAVILARVSSKSQEDEGYSLDSQLKLLQGYCIQRDLTVIKVFKIAETASKEQSRKVFQQLLTYLKEENIFHLAVEKTDRLTRNFSDAVAIDDWLCSDKLRCVHLVKENMMLHKEAKSDVKFMWNIHLSVAKKYTDNLREEAMKGWAEKLAQGWLPAPPPPGYMTIIQNGKRIHEPNPHTKALIRRAFEYYLLPGQSIESTAKELMRMGIKTRKGRPYFKSNVQRILTNPFYIGINRFNGCDYPGAQKTFISKDTFNKVQQKMRRKTNGRYRKHNPVFKSLIICSDCGKLVTWQKQKEFYYGACQRNTNNCKGKKLLREDKLEELLQEKMQLLVSPSREVIEWVATEMQAEHKHSLEQNQKLMESIQSQLERTKRMQSNLYDDKLAGEISNELYKEKNASLQEQKNELNTRMLKIDQTQSRQLEYALVLLELSQKAASIYTKKSPEQKRIIITKLFKDLKFQKGFLSVNYTNFARAIADNVLETNKLIGGAE